MPSILSTLDHDLSQIYRRVESTRMARQSWLHSLYWVRLLYYSVEEALLTLCDLVHLHPLPFSDLR